LPGDQISVAPRHEHQTIEFDAFPQ
jgi:hypothetical protein